MPDVNKPLENPKLLEAHYEMIKDQSENNIFLFEENLRQATFLAPVLIDDIESEEGSNELTLKKDTKIQFKTIQNNDGDVYLLAFTDWSALSKWSQEKEKTIFLQIKDYLAMLENSNELAGIVINPYQENIIANKVMLASLFGQHREYTIKEETPIKVGLHANPPLKLIEALKEFLPSIESVKSASLLRMDNNGNISHLIIVDTDQRDKDFPLIGNFASDSLVPGEYVDLITTTDSLGQDTLKNYEPFYVQENKKKGFFSRFK